MSTQHTPGPWTIITGSVYKERSSGGGDIPIAHMDREIGNGTVPVERDANARLIAAAPDLLTALEMTVPLLWKGHPVHYGDEQCDHCDADEAAKTAIAKAEEGA